VSFLDNVQLAFECPMRWEKLGLCGDAEDRKRFCSQCQKHVHNLSAMTRPEAERLLAASTTPICIRVELDAQGRAVHRPGLSRALLAATLVATAACASDEDSGLDSGSLGASTDIAAQRVDHHGSGSGSTIPELGGSQAGTLDQTVSKMGDSPSGTWEVRGEVPQHALPELESRPVMGEPIPVREVAGGIRPVLMGKPIAPQ
jgi:hypothetical protein